MQYDVDYFIDKFSKIPEDKWCVSMRFRSDGKSCAFGHCNLQPNEMVGEGDNVKFTNKEAASLASLIDMVAHKSNPYNTVYYVNDGLTHKYQQSTPKIRILAALYDVKKMQEKEVKEKCDNAMKKLAANPLPEFKSISLSKILQEETKLIGAS